MRTLILTVVMVLTFSPPVKCQQRWLDVLELAVGQKAPFHKDASFHIVQIVNKNEMVVYTAQRGDGPGGSLDRLYITGVDTSALVDNKEIRLPGVFQVEGTKQWAGRTIFHIAAETKEEREKREAAEAKAKAEQSKLQAEREQAKKQKQKAAKNKEEEDRAKAKREAESPERKARAILRLGNSYRDEAKDAIGEKKQTLLDKARGYYKDVLKKYPDTKAAGDAKKVLKDLED